MNNSTDPATRSVAACMLRCGDSVLTRFSDGPAWRRVEDMHSLRETPGGGVVRTGTISVLFNDGTSDMFPAAAKLVIDADRRVAE